MRITCRARHNADYWRKRWEDIPVDEASDSPDAYPQKYAEMLDPAPGGPILEAGCGNGRILRCLKAKGLDIVGMDFIHVALGKLRQADSSLDLVNADVVRLPFADGSFGGALAFGLYHNLETGLGEALMETRRILKPGGMLCASFRADNAHSRIIDALAARRAAKTGRNSEKFFHKVNLTRQECLVIARDAGFTDIRIFAAQNFPVLYKFRIFRRRSQKTFEESCGRKEGYRLSPLGTFLQNALMRFFPDQACNVFVLFARNPEN